MENKNIVGECNRGLSVVAIVTVADIPMMLDQIVDSCHTFMPSGLCEAPVTLKHRRIGTVMHKGYCLPP